MKTENGGSKAIVHISGTLLRRTWYGKESHSCIIVRPAGKDRDTVAYIVNQAKFTGPSELVFNIKPREKPGKESLASPEGFVGGLPGFDNSVLVYLEVEENHIHVQPKHGDAFIPFSELHRQAHSGATNIPRINPMLLDGC